MELDRNFICKSKECCWLVVGFCFFSQRSWTKQIMSNNWFLKPPRICDSCLASSTTKCDQRMHFKNFGPSQAWSLTEISHEQYLAMPGQISVWRSVPGWTLESCVFDWMHNVYLGHGRDLVGSTLKVLIEKSVYDHLRLESVDAILAYIQEEMVTDCSRFGFLGYQTVEKKNLWVSVFENHFPQRNLFWSLMFFGGLKLPAQVVRT